MVTTVLGGLAAVLVVVGVPAVAVAIRRFGWGRIGGGMEVNRPLTKGKRVTFIVVR
jgi:hypothetical protein